MSRQGIRTAFTLERVANCAVILSVLVAFTILCHNLFVKSAKPNIARGLAKGQVLPQLTNYNRYQNTLLLVMNTECGYCKASLPFYSEFTFMARCKSGRDFRTVRAHFVDRFSNRICIARLPRVTAHGSFWQYLPISRKSLWSASFRYRAVGVRRIPQERTIA